MKIKPSYMVWGIFVNEHITKLIIELYYPDKELKDFEI